MMKFANLHFPSFNGNICSAPLSGFRRRLSSSAGTFDSCLSSLMLHIVVSVEMTFSLTDATEVEGSLT
jgi:hypothetical protein